MTMVMMLTRPGFHASNATHATYATQRTWQT